MADRLQIYGGLKADMPELLPREIGYCTDTNELYIGSLMSGNKLVGAVRWENEIKEKLTAVKADHLEYVALEATTQEIATAFNQLLSNLKVAGIMKDIERGDEEWTES